MPLVILMNKDNIASRTVPKRAWQNRHASWELRSQTAALHFDLKVFSETASTQRPATLPCPALSQLVRRAPGPGENHS